MDNVLQTQLQNGAKPLGCQINSWGLQHHQGNKMSKLPSHGSRHFIAYLLFVLAVFAGMAGLCVEIEAS